MKPNAAFTEVPAPPAWNSFNLPPKRLASCRRYAGIALFSALAAVAALSSPAAEPVLHNFITVKGDQLMDGDRPFRFVSFNIPNLHFVEDNVAFAEENPYRLPDRFETRDALETIKLMGGQVVRTYVLSVARTNDEPGIPRHVLGPGKFNEETFRALDLVLQVANDTGTRLILPMVDNWIWWGGRAEYAGFRGKPVGAFWTDPQVITDFKETIRYVLNRTNSLTGVAYRDDKAILCWETGNELQSPAAWTREIAAWMKSLDTNHLVMDGYHATELREESLTIPEIDIVTTHHYPGMKKSYAQLVRENWAKAKGRKPYVVGEFGFVETAQIAALLDALQETGTAGALLWSLRPRNRDGGFYWHSEPAGGNKYKAYHWPGFASGDDYDEAALMTLMRRKAFAVRGLPLPPIPPPAPPRLLPLTDPAGISWQGSVGATSYVVERASNPGGPWTVAAANVDESAVQYRPTYTETGVGKGTWYYRVCARNNAGVSPPSNVTGPLALTCRLMLDELADFSQIYKKEGTLTLENRDCRKAKEDAHRVAGKPGSALVYRLPGPVRSCRVFSFFPGEIADFRISCSDDGQAFQALPAERHAYFHGAGDYGYWKPVLYTSRRDSGTGKFLRIEFADEAQIGRVEIGYSE